MNDYKPFKTIKELIETHDRHFRVKKRPNGSMPLIWVIDKTLAPSTIHLITGYSTSDNSIEIDSAWYSVSEIVDLFTFLDKMPCGISLGNPNKAPVQKKIPYNGFRKSNFGGKR